MAALKRRTQPKPEAEATWLIDRLVSSMSFLAKCRRRVCATALGVAPRWRRKSRRRWREPTPSRSASASTPPSSRPLSPMRRSARATVLGVPSQAGVPGEHSGRQRRHGRKPASDAAAAVGKYCTLLSFAVRAGQIDRQYTPLVCTPMKNLPSKRASRDSRAREQTRQSRGIRLRS